jgi:biotin operon repressor
MKRQIAILGTGAALALAGCGSDAPARTTPAPRGPDATALAEELGVAVTKLDVAMQKLRESGGRPDDMAAALAQELGLSTAKVKAALKATRPQGMPPGNAPAPSGTPAGAVAA